VIAVQLERGSPGICRGLILSCSDGDIGAVGGTTQGRCPVTVRARANTDEGLAQIGRGQAESVLACRLRLGLALDKPEGGNHLSILRLEPKEPFLRRICYRASKNPGRREARQNTDRPPLE